MFYANRSIYYTLSGKQEPLQPGVLAGHRGLVGRQPGDRRRHQPGREHRRSRPAASVDFTIASGMFVANGSLWYATRLDGKLHKAAVERHDRHRARAPSTRSATGNWAATAVFVSPTRPRRPADGELHRLLLRRDVLLRRARPPPPRARRSPRTPGTSVTASTGTGVKPSHTYTAVGNYQVKLTVTNAQNADRRTSPTRRRHDR